MNGVDNYFSPNLAATCYLKEVGRRLLRDVHRRSDDHVAAVVREQAALPVEVLPIRGHIGDVVQREEALKQATSDVERALVVGRQERFPVLASQQVLGRLAALVFVDLWEKHRESGTGQGRVSDRRVAFGAPLLWSRSAAASVLPPGTSGRRRKQ